MQAHQVQSIQPMQSGVTTQDQQETGVRPGFAHKSAKAFGICHITCGGLVMLFGFVAIGLSNYLSHSGTSIWCGGLFIITGILGVVSSYQKTTGIIVASMVMSIISIVSGFPLLITSSIACRNERYIYDCQGMSPYGFYYEPCGQVVTRQLIDGLIILLAIVEIIIAIINSVLCCRAVCCGARRTEQQPVMYYIPAQQMNVQTSVIMLPPGAQVIGPAQGPQQGYGAQPMYAQPQYAQPQYPQPQYAQPQYQQPQYPQEQYGQPQFQPEPQSSETAPPPPAYTSTVQLGGDNSSSLPDPQM